MSILDFLFRRGNPTNAWRRAPNLNLTVTLNKPSLNGVPLGGRLNRLSDLGRNDQLFFGSLLYFDLGIGIEYDDDGTLQGFTITMEDESNVSKPYQGELLWKGDRLEPHQYTRESLRNAFGDWYWFDADDYEFIAFYEFRDFEMQVELTLDGKIKQFIVSKNRLMADTDQRKAYKVDKPWPPNYD